MYTLFPIGWLVSLVLLVVIYYGVLTPVALVRRALGHEALKRRFEPGRASYWEPRPAVDDAQRYFQQF